MSYAPLWCKSNFSFLEGASHAEELVEEAHRLGLRSIAITDRDGVYGLVRAHMKAKELGIQLICGVQVTVAAPAALLAASPVRGLHQDDHLGRGPGWGADTDDLEPAIAVTGRRGRTKRAKPRSAQLGLQTSTAANEAVALPTGPSRIVLLAMDRGGWANLTRLVTAGRRRCDKGESLVAWSEVCERSAGVIAIWHDLLAEELEPSPLLAADLKRAFGDRLYAAIARHRVAHQRAIARFEDVQRQVRAREQQRTGERKDRETRHRSAQVNRMAESRRRCACDHGSSSPTAASSLSSRSRAAASFHVRSMRMLSSS